MNTQQRLRVVGVFVLILLVALTGRLGVLQTVESVAAKRQAARNIFETVAIEPTRGRILDRHGRILVDNLALNVVRIDRTKLKKADRIRVLSRLSTLLNVPFYQLEKNLDSNIGGEFAPREVARRVKESVAVELAEHADLYPSVSVGTVWERVYPNGMLAAHVLGYVGKVSAEDLARQPVSLGYAGADYIGKVGIERSFERELRGSPGAERITKDRLSRVVDREVVKEPIPGKDVRLAIDIDIQKLLEDTLAQTIRAARQNVDADNTSIFIKATAGAGVITDPNTGEVLAMASLPTYDPRDFVPSITQDLFEAKYKGDDKGSPLTNRASYGLYPPGSTFKLFTALAGLKSRMITPDTVINDQGAFERQDLRKRGVKWRWRNAGEVALGPTTLRKAIRESSDVYFYTIGNAFAELSKAKENGIQAMAKDMGLGRPTNVRLPDERGGAVPDETYRKKQTATYGRKKFPNDSWFTGDTINVSIGQGEVLASPLGIARAYGTFVNGGTVVDAKIDLEARERVIGPAPSTRPTASTVRAASSATSTNVAPSSSVEPGAGPVSLSTTTVVTGGLLGGAGLDNRATVTTTAPGSAGLETSLGIPVRPTLPPINVKPIVENHLDFNEAERAVLLDGFEDVTSADGGTARGAFAGFPSGTCRVGGKTGTAQRKPKQDTSLFVGFGPLPNPKYVAVIVIEEGGFGRQAAAGVRRLFEGLCGLPLEPVRSVVSGGKEF